MRTYRFLPALIFAAFLAALHPAVLPDASAEEMCRQCPFDCRGIGAGPDHCRDLSYRGGQCCVDLDRRGREQLQRKDMENSRGRFSDDARGGFPDESRAGFGDDCPPGTHARDRLCSPEERRQGCTDRQSPSGRICIGGR